MCNNQGEIACHMMLPPTQGGPPTSRVGDQGWGHPIIHVDIVKTDGNAFVLFWMISPKYLGPPHGGVELDNLMTNAAVK